MKEEDGSKLSAVDRCQQARSMWLQATTMNELDQVEALYQSALNATKTTTSTTTSHQDKATKKKKKKKKDMRPKRYAELSPSDYRQTGEKLSLLYCQSGRTVKAKRGLAYLGFECRLARLVLDYPMKSSSSTQRNTTTNSTPPKKRKKLDEPCIILDNFLHAAELQNLQDTLQDPSANYWTHHQYHVEPPSPYFSYVIDLRKGGGSNGMLGKLARQIQKQPLLVAKFPQLQFAPMVEVWAHNRPHASGHQLHFDSDDEGRGGVRNPVCSTILYLSNDERIGGPSLVTNQRLTSTQLATMGWLVHPKPRRLVVFDGGVLHGVIPGKGVPLLSSTCADGNRPDGTSRRVTLMLAFWTDIEVRDEPTPGSARPFPSMTKNQSRWAREFVSSERAVLSQRPKDMEVIRPISLSTIYETLDGQPWTSDMGMPAYDKVFQGF